jgi:hypothetical protein
MKLTITAVLCGFALFYLIAACEPPGRDEHYLSHGEFDDVGDLLDDDFADEVSDATNSADKEGRRFLNVFHHGGARSKGMGKYHRGGARSKGMGKGMGNYHRGHAWPKGMGK